MAPGVHAGDEVGPSHRTLGRIPRLQADEGPSVLVEPCQGRQFALLHPHVHQVRVHAVESQDDQFFLSGGLPHHSCHQVGASSQGRGRSGRQPHLQEIASVNGTHSCFLSQRADFAISGVLRRVRGGRPQLHPPRLPSTANSTRELSMLHTNSALCFFRSLLYHDPRPDSRS